MISFLCISDQGISPVRHDLPLSSSHQISNYDSNIEEKRKSFLQSPSNIVDPESMPELVRVKFMLREIQRDFRLRDALGQLTITIP